VINENEALTIAKAYVDRMSKRGIELQLVNEKTQRRGFGWEFFYDSNAHLSTGDPRYLIAGNAP
jgi:hypothetical protein